MLSTPTNASSWLGSSASGLVLGELEKVIAGRWDEVAVNHEVLVDCRSHRCHVSRIPWRPSCRFDHQTWKLIPVEFERATIDGLLAQADVSPAEASLSAPLNPFVLKLVCHDCGCERDVFRFSRQLTDADRICAGCGARLVVDGFNIRDRVCLDEVPGVLDGRPLETLGLRPGDVFSLESSSDVLHYSIAADLRPPQEPGVTTVVLGCGNTGSHVAPHLGRQQGISRVILVDPDVYEPANLRSQDIRLEDVGRPKVRVQADRLEAIRPELEVLSFESRLEDVPLGYYQDSVAISCLDSRVARLQLNQIVWRIGSTLIDTAVDAASRLCRVSVFVPGERNPCIECGWSPDDYQLLEQVSACDAAFKREEN
jgi:hypothetical protein